MARDFQIAGECMVYVKGAAGSLISSLSELGLADGPIQVMEDSRHMDINVDAFGGEVPPEIQYKLSAMFVTMRLVHYDPVILSTCLRESKGGSAAPGFMPRAGTRLGNNSARFAATNHFIGLNIAAPVNGIPYRFYFAYLVNPPFRISLGTERSLVELNWRAIPYQSDPWGNGTGSLLAPVYDNVLDN